MARNRFVQPETVRLPLSEGDWILVKKRLTYGEEQRLAAAALGKVSRLDRGDAEVSLDMERFAVERLEIWIVDWSFWRHSPECEDSGHCTPDCQPVRFCRDAIAHLDPDTVEEIDAALERHIQEMEDAKKARSGTPSLEGRSP